MGSRPGTVGRSPRPRLRAGRGLGDRGEMGGNRARLRRSRKCAGDAPHSRQGFLLSRGARQGHRGVPDGDLAPGRPSVSRVARSRPPGGRGEPWLRPAEARPLHRALRGRNDGGNGAHGAGSDGTELLLARLSVRLPARGARRRYSLFPALLSRDGRTSLVGRPLRREDPRSCSRPPAPGRAHSEHAPPRARSRFRARPDCGTTAS